MFYNNRYVNFKGLLFSLLIFSIFCVQPFSLSAIVSIAQELSQLDHPAAKLIQKKLNKLSKLSLDEDNPKNIDKFVKILVDLKFDLWNQYQIHVCLSDALDMLKDSLKVQGIEDAEKYLKPIKRKLKKAVNDRYKEEKKHPSNILINPHKKLDIEVDEI